MLTTQNIDPTAAAAKPPFFLLRWLRQLREWVAPPTQAHQDRQSDTARKVTATIIVVLCVSMMGLAIAFARPIKDSYDDWRATKLVNEARELLRDKNDVLAAVLKAQEAVSKAPEHTEAVRMNAELLTLMARNEAIYFWDKLEKLGQSTIADKRGKVRALLRLTRVKEASLLLEKLLRENPADAALTKLSEEVWGKSQSNEVVRNAIEEYTKLHQDDTESRLNLYVLQLKSNVPSEMSKAVEGLWALGEKETDMGVQALLLLTEYEATSPGSLSLADKIKLLAMIGAHAKSTEEARVAALGLRIALDPKQREPLIDMEMRRCAALPREELYPLVRWLVVQRDFSRVLNFLTPRLKDIKSFQPLMLNYLTALSALERWQEVEALVTDKEVILSVPNRAFYEAHLASIKGKSLDEVKRLMMIVVTSGQGDAELLMNLGAYCETPQRQLLDIAELAYEACTRVPRKDRQAFPGWIRVAKARGNTAGLLKAAAEANRRYPDDQNYIENVLYARLLIGLDLENSLARAVRLLTANPNDSVRKLIVALGYWRLYDDASAIENCQKIDLNYTSVGQQAIFAAIAYGAGFKPEAELVLNKIPANAMMLPEEREIWTRIAQAK